MKQVVQMLALLMLACASKAQTLPQKLSESDFVLGKTLTIESLILDENRELNVYFPPGYATDSLKTYPVIYVLDGSKDEDFIHLSGLVSFASFPWIKMMPESIVVGIGNVDRKRDFTFPSGNEEIRKQFPTSGGSEKFIRFIEKELQPFIDSSYRTNSVKTLVGQSLGGLLATEILLKSPGLFSNYIIVSPSLWWDDASLLDVQPRAYQSEKSVYIAVGREGRMMEKSARQLYKKLKRDKSPQTKLYFDFLKGKTHGDVLHMAVYRAFEKVFRMEKV